MLTYIVNSKPDNINEAIAEMLTEVKKGVPADQFSRKIYEFPEQFLSTEEFEAIFDSYDVLQINTVPKAYLVQALKVCGVVQAEKILQERYPELAKEESVNKVTFVYVLEEEHRRVGFSQK